MTSGLTPRMAQCLQAIRDLTKDGVAPSYDVLAARLGLKSKSGVLRLLYGMEERGLVVWDRGRARSLRIIERPSREDLARLSNADLRALMDDIEDIVAGRDDRCEARA